MHAFTDLQKKCEDFLAVSPSNLYISGASGAASFIRLQSPPVISHLIQATVRKQAHALEVRAREQTDARAVLIWIDPFGLGYASLAVDNVDGALCAVTFGPVVTERLRTEELRYIGYQRKLDSYACKLLENYLSVVPSMDGEALKRVASMMAAYFLGDGAPYTITLENHQVEPAAEDPSLGNAFEQRSFVAENYAIEAKLFSAVEHGDLEFIRDNMAKYMREFFLPARFPSDPLRETKNLCITANSLLARAAIKGGVDASTVHNMSDTYAVRIEQQTKQESVGVLLWELMQGYTQAVREYALRTCSQLVVSAVIFVHRHISSPVSLADIAQELYVSREHLSRRFHAEMNMTLSEYIHRAKIRESLPLLLSQRYDVGQIAFLFGYSSPPHYTKMFQRFMNLSPKQWQKQQAADARNGIQQGV